MPCAVTEEEKAYYANIGAKRRLESMKVHEDSYVIPNEKLCNICSKMSLDELKSHDLESWYLNHLFIDGKREPMRVVEEILRLYKSK